MVFEGLTEGDKEEGANVLACLLIISLKCSFRKYIFMKTLICLIGENT